MFKVTIESKCHGHGHGHGHDEGHGHTLKANLMINISNENILLYIVATA